MAVEGAGAVELMAELVIDPVALAALFRSEEGPVMRNLALRATNVQRIAKSLVGVSSTPHGLPGNITESGGGHLRDEIVKRFISDSQGVAYAVGVFGADAQRALWHHQGTPPHSISPRNPNGMLVFYWPKAGRVVYFRHVNHPGSKPNPFLTRALEEGLQAGQAT